MSKIGVRIKINLSKIDKARLYKGAKGEYLDATVFIDPENPGQYGDHGMITQDVTKAEREAGEKGPAIGNVKVFWRDDSAPQPSQQGFQQDDDEFQGDSLPF